MDDLRLLCTMHYKHGNSDKVWGYFCVSESAEPMGWWDKPVFVFWGARGKALQLKEHAMSDKLLQLKRSKRNKGYEAVSANEFLEQCPNFFKEVDDKLTFAILAGNKYKAVG